MCLYVCMHTCTGACEDRSLVSGAGPTDGCCTQTGAAQPGCWEAKPVPLEEQDILGTVEPSL